MQNQKIVPFLWFENNAEEAIRFYTKVFPRSKAIQLAPLVCSFELEGMEVMILNGGPAFKLNEAFSFFVHCEDQAEVDRLWSELSEGGSTSQCGWLKDRFGVSWQIVPKVLTELLSGSDTEKSKRVMDALMGMQKIDIAGLQNA